MASTSALCLSCSSPLLGGIASSSTFLTPCCSSPICSPCLVTNPRLRYYIPCLKCGDGVQALKASRKKTLPTRAAGGRGADAAEETERRPVLDDRFSLGDDDSDGEGDLDDEESDLGTEVGDAEGHGVAGSTSVFSDSTAPPSPPPGYTFASSTPFTASASTTTPASPRHDSPTRSMRSGFSASTSASQKTAVGHLPAGSGVKGQEDKENSKEGEDDRMKHFVKRGDTVRSIAVRYAMDPYDLMQYNSLPHTALSTNPQLLQTRKFIYLQPSRLRESLSAPSGTPDAPHQRVGEWELSEEEAERERKRKEARMLKRFQLVTKETDRGVAKTYLALQQLELGEGSSSSSAGGSTAGSVLFSAGEDAFGDSTELPGYRPGIGSFKFSSSDSKRAMEESEKGEKQQKGSREQGAVNHFFDDEAWEAAQGGSGASKSLSSGSSGVGGGFLSLIGGKKEHGKFKTGERVQGAPWVGGGSSSTVKAAGRVGRWD